MILDHSTLGVENKSGRIYVRQVYFKKILPTSLGTCKPTFYTFYTPHLRWAKDISQFLDMPFLSNVSCYVNYWNECCE